MQPSAQESYLVTEVLTATPQKLQLMLIDAALRAARRARQQWQAENDEQACEALIHAQQVVGELLASLDHEIDADLVKKVAAVYLFVFRSLMEANHEHSEQKLDDAIRVLELEQQTWRQVCEELGGKEAPENRAEGSGFDQSAAAPSPAVALPADRPEVSADQGMADGSAGSGLSLEA